jgi:hypothetical protein
MRKRKKFVFAGSKRFGGGLFFANGTGQNLTNRYAEKPCPCVSFRPDSQGIFAAAVRNFIPEKTALFYMNGSS